LNYPELNKEQWAELMERLTRYAQYRIASLFWRGVRTSAEQLAGDVVVDVIEERRKWDNVKCPDFYEFLKGAVDSKLSHAIESISNKRVQHLGDGIAVDGGAPLQAMASRSNPAMICEIKEHHERFKSAVRKAVAENPVATKLFECFEAGITKRSEIAELLDVAAVDITNAQKCLRRAAQKAIRSLEGGERQ
jgi:hypothetical protein